jgi:single-strand DNA-binding protein
MNIAIVSGNLGGSAKTSVFSNGNTKYAFSLATSGGYTDANGQWVDQTEWHTIETIVSAKATEKLHNYYKNGLVKGAKVSVKGMNRTSKWKDEQGVDVYKRYISVEYSDGGKIEINSANTMENQTVESAVEDVPF